MTTTIKTQDEADKLAEAAEVLAKHGVGGLDGARCAADRLTKAADLIEAHGFYWRGAAAEAASEFKPEPTYKDGQLAKVTLAGFDAGRQYIMRKVAGGWSYRMDKSGAEYASVLDGNVGNIEPIELVDPSRPVQLTIGNAAAAARTLLASGDYPKTGAAVQKAVDDAIAARYFCNA